MWTETVTGIDPFVCEGQTVPSRKRRRAPTPAPIISEVISTPPSTVRRPPSDSALSVKTFVQIGCVLGLCWYISSTRDAATSAGAGMERQGVSVIDNAVQETKSKQFEQAVPDYIERFAPVAIQEMEKFGIPASISLAQGLLESRAGTSKIAVATNNHFGLKCFSRGCKKGHCKNFADDTHKDFFLNYNGGAWGSWRRHSILLSSGRYQKLHGRDWQGWADGLQAVGYATDPNYAAALKQIIKRYDLHRFDR